VEHGSCFLFESLPSAPRLGLEERAPQSLERLNYGRCMR